MLILFVCAESQTTDLKTPQQAKKGLAALVLNRVKDKSFPNSIKEVILQPNQFACVKNGEFPYTAKNFTQEELKQGKAAVEAALNGDDPTGGALFYDIASNESAVTKEFGWFIFLKNWPY